MDWPAIGIGVSVLVAAASFIKTFFFGAGYDRRRLEEHQARFEEFMEENEKEHIIFRIHREDSDAHWTRREREDLNRRLALIDEIHPNVLTLLELSKRRGNSGGPR